MADKIGTFRDLHPDKVIVSAFPLDGRIIIVTRWNIFEILPDARILPLKLKERYVG